MMTNVEWLDLLAKEWNVSRSVAKEMLHQIYQIKAGDILRKERDHVHSDQNK